MLWFLLGLGVRIRRRKSDIHVFIAVDFEPSKHLGGSAGVQPCSHSPIDSHGYLKTCQALPKMLQEQITQLLVIVRLQLQKRSPSSPKCRSPNISQLVCAVLGRTDAASSLWACGLGNLPGDPGLGTSVGSDSVL